MQNLYRPFPSRLNHIFLFFNLEDRSLATDLIPDMVVKTEKESTERLSYEMVMPAVPLIKTTSVQ